MDSRNALAAALIGSLLLACQGPSPATYPQARGPLQPDVPQPDAEPRAPLTAAVTTWSPNDSLEALLLRAEGNNPAVRAAYQEWLAAQARVPQVMALPNPWVSLSGYLQAVETRTGPMDGRLGVTQKFPWPGKLETAGDRASALAEGVRMKVEDARLRVRRSFLRSWSERVYLAKAERITSAQVALLQHIEDVSLSLYESSKVSQADVLRAQVERLEMADRLDTLRQREQPLEAALESVLGAAMEPLEDWHDLALLDRTDLREEDGLRTALLASSPQLAALEARLAAAQESQRLADLDGMPDFSLSADWTWIGSGNPTQPDAGNDALALTLAIELPIQRGRIEGARSQALAENRQVLELRSQRQWQLLTELQSAMAAHDDALRRVALFEEQLLPKAEQTYETTLAAYQSGQAAFQDMLDAARVVLDFRLSTVRARTDAALAYADLNGLLPASQLISENTDR